MKEGGTMTEFTGKTIEEAIDRGLEALDVPRNQALITVKRSATNGFFGIGRQKAMVEITVVEEKDKVADKSVYKYRPPMRKPKVQPQEEQPVEPQYKKRPKTPRLSAEQVVNELTDYLTEVISQMGFQVQLLPTVKNMHSISYEIKTDNENRLIGRHGRTLNALQRLGQIYVNRKGANDVNVALDVAGYRQRRKVILTRLADKTAMEVIANGKPVYLNPMPPYERKIIHQALADNEHVWTYSSGKENHRSVVVAQR